MLKLESLIWLLHRGMETSNFAKASPYMSLLALQWQSSDFYIFQLHVNISFNPLRNLLYLLLIKNKTDTNKQFIFCFWNVSFPSRESEGYPDSCERESTENGRLCTVGRWLLASCSGKQTVSAGSFEERKSYGWPIKNRVSNYVAYNNAIKIH